MPDLVDDPALDQEDVTMLADATDTSAGAPAAATDATASSAAVPESSAVAPSATSQPNASSPLPPPLWNDVKAVPAYQQMTPEEQQTTFAHWVWDSSKYLQQAGVPRPQLDIFKNYVQQESPTLGINFVWNPNGLPQTLGERNAIYNAPNDPKVPLDFPYTVDIKPPSTNVIPTVERGVGAFESGLGSLFTKDVPDGVAKLWDYVTGTTPGTSALDRGIATVDQNEKEQTAEQGSATPEQIFGESIGKVASTFLGGPSLLRMAPLAFAQASDDTYHNALDQGATPEQAMASAGVAGTVSAATLAVLGPLNKMAISGVLGKNAEAFLAGAYRPSVAEAAKLMGLDAAGLAGTGYAGQILQNKADQMLYDPDRSLTQGALEAAGQSSLFALIHAPTILKAMWDNRSELTSAQTGRSNALVELDAAQASGDPTRIKAAETAYNNAEATFQDLVTDTAKNAPDPTPEDAQEAQQLVNDNPSAPNPLDDTIAQATKESQKPELPLVGEEMPQSEEAQPDAQTSEGEASEPTTESIGQVVEPTSEAESERPEETKSAAPVEPSDDEEGLDPSTINASLKTQVDEAVANQGTPAKVVWTDEEHPGGSPAWADPAKPGRIFINPRSLTDALGKLNSDQERKDYIARVVDEEDIHDAQHQVEGGEGDAHEQNVRDYHAERTPEEIDEAVSRYGSDAIDPRKAISPEDALNRMILFRREHARQVLQRKLRGETTEDVWKQRGAPALTRYLTSLYQRIKARIAQFGGKSQLSRYLTAIEGAMKDREKATGEPSKLDVTGAPVPPLGHGESESGNNRPREEAETAFRAGSPEAVADVIRRTANSNSEEHGSAPLRSEQIRAFYSAARRLGKTVDIGKLRRIAHGAEHEIFQVGDRVWKATAPDRFGLGLGDDQSATPIGYFDRLDLQNKIFGDDLRFEGLTPDRRTVTSQPTYRGDTPSDSEIHDYLTENGFELRRAPRDVGGSSHFWYDPRNNVVVADAHARNFKKLDDGQIRPIDLIMAQPNARQRSMLGIEEKTGGGQPTFAARVPELSEEEKPSILDKAGESQWQAAKDVFKRFARERLTDLKEYTPRLKATMQYLRKIQQKIQNSNEVRAYIRAALPDATTRGAVVRWIEAGGDKELLARQAEATKDENLKAFYEAAQYLTPDEQATANKISTLLEAYRQKAATWGLQVNKLDKYFPHFIDKSGSRRKLGGPVVNIKTTFDQMKQRTYPTMFDGEQNGIAYHSDAADGVAAYLNTLDHAIASRQYIAELAKGKESDGRPMLAPPRSAWSDLTSPKKGSVHLVFDARPPEEMDDYVHTNIPALKGWAWAGEANGKTVLHQNDLYVHPDTAKFLNKVFGMSGISGWWRSPSTTATEAVGKAALKFLLNDLNAIAKSNLFAFSPVFHPLQIGMEAMGHGVNPKWNVAKLDLNDPDVADAMDHTLTLGSEDSDLNEESRSDTNKTILRPVELLAQKLGADKTARAIGWFKEANQAAQDWIFKTYIPAIKYQTYRVALSRNMEWMSKDLSSGKISEDQVKYMTAEQVNNAYGELNYVALERHPDVQLMLRNLLLAPDFFEARARHLGQAISGIALQSGREQFRAIAMIGMGLAVSAQITNILVNGEMDLSHPFEARIGNRYYGMRSSPGDALNLFNDIYTLLTGGTRGIPYINNRMSPMLRFIDELRTGTNWRGEKVGAEAAVTDFIANNSPMAIQPFASKVPVLGQFFTSSKNSPVSPFEQVLTALGIKVSRYSPLTEMETQARDWVARHGDEIGLTADNTTYPVSKYRPLRYALEDGDFKAAANEYQSLMQGAKDNAAKVSAGFETSLHHPFTGSAKGDQAFFKSLDSHDQALSLFKAAIARKAVLLQRFNLMRSGKTN